MTATELIPIVTSIIALLTVIVREIISSKKNKEFQVLKAEIESIKHKELEALKGSIDIIKNREIESLKTQMELVKKYGEEMLKVYIESNQEKQQAEISLLKSYIKQTQSLKESARDIIANPAKYGLKTTAKELDEIRFHIRNLYATAMPNLSVHVQKYTHTVKNFSDNLVFLIVNFVEEPKNKQKKRIQEELEKIPKLQADMKQLLDGKINELLINLESFVKKKLDAHSES